MDNYNTGTYDIYRDINARTGGEIYIGVVGPVRTGKSTFIKRFMDLLVIPNIEDANSRERAIDELPQSAAGKTVMTTEPKFIPKEAAQIQIADDITLKVRMIDCVGYMVEGALGHIENEQERMVKTPWFEYEIPFTQAAEIGTKKVINEHSSIGIVVTTDGSIGELSRENYLLAEQKTVEELKKIGKPFVILLNSVKPYGETATNLAKELSEIYDTEVLPVNCEQLRKEDIHRILSIIVDVFPVTEIGFYPPKWTELLDKEHYLKKEIIAAAKEVLSKMRRMKDAKNRNCTTESPHINGMQIGSIGMEDGTVSIQMNIDEVYYYEMISNMTGLKVDSEYQFLSVLKELAGKKNEFEKVSSACEQVKMSGYGVVTPAEEEISIDEPELIRHGNKFGVKIKATAPSIHMIQANIMTEIAPIVGSEEQAMDLIGYMKEQKEQTEGGIWETNIFGKTMKQLVEEGMTSKINRMTEESQRKLQDTMQKIINDSNGGLICIII